jgi:hypothetical protein
MRKVVDAWWYNSHNIGIVKALDVDTGETLFFIGKILGLNAEEDKQYILDWGEKFYPNQIK